MSDRGLFYKQINCKTITNLNSIIIKHNKQFYKIISDKQGHKRLVIDT